jgi:hypothetical protein
MSEDCCKYGQEDCCKEQAPEVDPRVAALNEAMKAQQSDEGQQNMALAREQISAVLKETECRLVPVTQIIGNQITQGVEVVYAPKRRIMPANGGLVVERGECDYQNP